MRFRSGMKIVVDTLETQSIAEIEQLQKEARLWSAEIRRQLRLLADDKLAGRMSSDAYAARRLEKQQEAAQCKQVITKLTGELSMRRQRVRRGGTGTAKSPSCLASAVWTPPRVYIIDPAVSEDFTAADRSEADSFCLAS